MYNACDQSDVYFWLAEFCWSKPEYPLYSFINPQAFSTPGAGAVLCTVSPNLVTREWRVEVNEWMNELMSSWTYQSINQWQYRRHCSCRSRSFYMVLLKKPLPGKFPTETQWNNQPPEKKWRGICEATRFRMETTRVGKAMDRIGLVLVPALPTVPLVKKNASDAARFDFLGLDFLNDFCTSKTLNDMWWYIYIF